MSEFDLRPYLDKIESQAADGLALAKMIVELFGDEDAFISAPDLLEAARALILKAEGKK